MGVLVPQITEDSLPIVPQERDQHRVPEQIMDTRVPQLTEAVVEVTLQERVQNQLAVEVFKVFAQARVPQLPHPVVRFLTLMRDFNGFPHFTAAQKKCEGYLPVESESARQCRLIHAGRSSNGSSRGV